MLPLETLAAIGKPIVLSLFETAFAAAESFCADIELMGDPLPESFNPVATPAMPTFSSVRLFCENVSALDSPATSADINC